MSVAPSCPVLVVHDDDPFRKALIVALDRKHFTVTYAPDGDQAVDMMKQRSFHIVVVSLDPKSRKGLQALEYIKENRSRVSKGVIIVGDPSPELRGFARLADETLMKPVDPNYVADRARVYCNG